MKLRSEPVVLSRMGPDSRASAAFPFRVRVSEAQEASNPLLEAARTLLQALADTPVELDNQAARGWRLWLQHEVRIFERVCAELQLRADLVHSARYCLCTALDEAAIRSDWGKHLTNGKDWNTNCLAMMFGGDRQGGDRVFEIARQAMRSPHENLDLLEVIQNILDLGFEGRYRCGAGARNRLSAFRHELHDTVVVNAWNPVGPQGDSRALSPIDVTTRPRVRVDPWVRHAGPVSTWRSGWSTWLRLTALMTVAILGISIYVGYERLLPLSSQSASVIDTLATGLSTVLKSDIAARNVSLIENFPRTSLTLRFNDVFQPGETTVNGWVGQLVATVGQQVAAMPVKVQVAGYADGLAPDRHRMISNKLLSEDRAGRIMQILVAAGVPADRISVTGKGDTEPIARNDTTEGRTKNRRVEITFVQ